MSDSTVTRNRDIATRFWRDASQSSAVKVVPYGLGHPQNWFFRPHTRALASLPGPNLERGNGIGDRGPNAFQDLMNHEMGLRLRCF